MSGGRCLEVVGGSVGGQVYRQALLGAETARDGWAGYFVLDHAVFVRPHGGRVTDVFHGEPHERIAEALRRKFDFREGYRRHRARIGCFRESLDAKRPAEEKLIAIGFNG